LLIGCEQKFLLDSNGKLAEKYLLDKGYSVTSYEGSYVYNFTSQDLVDKPHKNIWAVQPVEPDSYIGKDVIQETFIVKNHPLSQIYGNKTKVSVFIYNGEVIGGTSFPAGDGWVGSAYSLEGKTMEEVLEETDFYKWSNEWDEKYSK